MIENLKKEIYILEGANLQIIQDLVEKYPSQYNFNNIYTSKVKNKINQECVWNSFRSWNSILNPNYGRELWNLLTDAENRTQEIVESGNLLIKYANMFKKLQKNQSQIIELQNKIIDILTPKPN